MKLDYSDSEGQPLNILPPTWVQYKPATTLARLAGARLVYGGPGTGKTHESIEKLREWQQRYGKAAVLYIGPAAGRSVAGAPEMPSDLKADATVYTSAQAWAKALSPSDEEIQFPEEEFTYAAWYVKHNNLDIDSERLAWHYRFIRRRGRRELSAGLVDLAKQSKPPTLIEMDSYVRAVEGAKKAAGNAADMVDLQTRALERIRPYKVVIIDAAQEMAPLDVMMVAEAVGEDTFTFLYFDDNQRVMGFGGCDPTWLRVLWVRAEQGKSKGKARVLSPSLRCPQSIMDVANRLIRGARTRVFRDAVGSNKPGVVRRLQGNKWLDGVVRGQAIVCRRNKQLDEKELELTNAGIPWVRSAPAKAWHPALEPATNAALWAARAALLGVFNDPVKLKALERVRGDGRMTALRLEALARDATHPLDLFPGMEPAKRDAIRLAWNHIWETSIAGDECLIHRNAVHLHLPHTLRNTAYAHVMVFEHTGWIPSARKPEAFADEMRAYYTTITRASESLVIIERPIGTAEGHYINLLTHPRGHDEQTER